MANSEKGKTVFPPLKKGVRGICDTVYPAEIQRKWFASGGDKAGN